MTPGRWSARLKQGKRIAYKLSSPYVSIPCVQVMFGDAVTLDGDLKNPIRQDNDGSSSWVALVVVVVSIAEQGKGGVKRKATSETQIRRLPCLDPLISRLSVLKFNRFRFSFFPSVTDYFEWKESNKAFISPVSHCGPHCLPSLFKPRSIKWSQSSHKFPYSAKTLEEKWTKLWFLNLVLPLLKSRSVSVG